MLTENDIERELRERLSAYGFKVLKLTTPGNIGVMDRMILRPRYSPGPPMFVEIKKPGKKLRPLQAAIGDDWRERGCNVLKPILSLHDCLQRCTEVLAEVMPDYMLKGHL